MEVTQKDYTVRSLIVAFIAAIVIPVQFVKIDGKYDNLPKSIPSIIGFFLTISIIRNSKHELSEAEKEISDRFEGLDYREQQLNERESIIVNLEKTAKSERDRKQAEINSKIQKLNENENDLSRRLESINQLIDDRAEIMAEKLNNSYIERERELEQEYQSKHSQVTNWYEVQHKKLKEYKHEVEIKIIEIKTEHNFEINKYERKVQELELVIQKLNNRIKSLNAPRYAVGGDEIAVSEANKIITFLWQHEPPIEVDSEPLAVPTQTGERETRFWLRLRDPLQFSLLRSQKVLDGIRFTVGKNANPVISQEQSTDLVRVTLPWNNQAAKPEEINKKSVENSLKSIDDVGSSRSWLVTGHPGAGKTSSLIYLGQQLGGQNAIKIALNPHQDEQSSYSKYGYIEINELSEILNYINLCKAELELRRKDKTRRFKLVICCDELGAILDCGDADEIMTIFRQLSVEGRKLNIIVLLGNHSQTTKAVLMDAEFRGAFYQLFLVGAARHAMEQPHRNTGLSKLEDNYIKNSAYPALLLANMQYSLVKHPTHGKYKIYRDKGNKPRNLQECNKVTNQAEILKLLGNSTLTFDENNLCITPINITGSQSEELPLFPEKSEKQHFEFWLELEELIEKHGKAHVIKETLNCKGRNYQQGLNYLDYLEKKYKND